jgi:hypothetical protein
MVRSSQLYSAIKTISPYEFSFVNIFSIWSSKILRLLTKILNYGFFISPIKKDASLRDNCGTFQTKCNIDYLSRLRDLLPLFLSGLPDLLRDRLR